MIIVCTGSHYHADVARALAKLLRHGQTILLIQGGTGGSLVVRRELQAAGSTAEVDVAEMDNYPYSLGCVPTPVISGLVAIASALTKRDFVAEGRTLERLGLAGRSVEQIRASVG